MIQMQSVEFFETRMSLMYDGGVRAGKIVGIDGYDYDLLQITVEPVPAPDPAPSSKRSNGGYFTPSQLMGAEYVLKLPGVRLIQPS